MPKVTIDGQEAEFEEGLTVIRAAERLGIEVPHYCWHPGLTIAGNCRMCLVDIEKVPKLQIACNTRVTDGMVVHTRNERVKKAQESVLEFLLVNHPIDCPICDQAGECKLQDYYMDFDQKASRFAVEEKVRKRKVVELGPQVVLDQERCILCLRCTRFLDEVPKTSELGVFERGDRCYIDLAPGKRLDNPYAGNVVDICPVGALTNRDFRFQSRVWYLKKTESVCPFCANGCNIEIHHREGQIYRFRPRYNPEVNDYWMCDEGRVGYRRVQGEGRLLSPLLRQDDDLRAVPWPEALDAVAARLGVIRREAGEGAVGAIVSAFATNEEAFLVRSLLGGPSTRLAGHAWSPPDARGDDLLIKADKNPNRRGLESLGIPTSSEAVERMLEEMRARELKGLVLFGADLVGNLGRERVEEALEALELLVLIDTRRTETSLYADAVLPAASFAETDGTFTNHAGRVQRIQRAFSPPGDALEGWRLLADLGRALGDSRPWPSAETVFDALSSEIEAFSGLDYARLGVLGAPASHANTGT
ncbi:MAG: molybdopterin-dependent oxidoreductase [Candidatus Binatia bacterium]